MSNYFRPINTILKGRTSETPMPDEKTISMYRTREYNDDFMRIMENSGKWLKKAPEKRSENNLFVNGNCSVTIREPISSLIVVGDIEENASVTAEKIVHVRTEDSDQVVLNIIERESQRGWTTNSEVAAGKARDESGFYVKRATLLLRTFSSILHNLKGIDDVKFVSICKRLVEYSEKIKEESGK